MKTITIAARKGGAGKSTLAAHMSVLAKASGARVLLIDTDPQGSLAYWWALRESKSPDMIEECESAKLARIANRARIEGVGLVIIDTPPHAETSILAAMRVSDLVLVPTRPGPFDLAAVAATLDLARQAKKAPLVVLNHTPVASGWGEAAVVTEARNVVHGLGAAVAGAAIAQRVALSHAIISGLTVGEYQPRGKAAKEIARLWAELQPMIKE